MFDTSNLRFNLAVRHFCALPDTASALAITRAFMDVRVEMHALLDSVEDEAVIPHQPAGRLIEQLYKTELVAYLQGDISALFRLRGKVREAARLLP
ncbi:hypothetical protein [Spirosoma migulaei]